MKEREHRASPKTRAVFYGWSKPDGAGTWVPDIFEEGPMERLLAEAKAKGIVSVYDTRRGACVWFEGAPGPALRELKATVLELLPEDVVPLAQERLSGAAGLPASAPPPRITHLTRPRARPRQTTDKETSTP